MDLGYMLSSLFTSIYSIMVSFSFTIGGVTVNLFQFFCFMTLAGFLLSFVNSLHGGD